MASERADYERAKNWSSEGARKRESSYFLLIDSKIKPVDDNEARFVEKKLDEFMVLFRDRLGDIVTFNNTKNRVHHWGRDVIDRVEIRYVVEKGRGGYKKDGTKKKSGGTLHIHACIRIYHYSNITLRQEPIYDLANDFLWRELGVRPFVAKPKLITPDRCEEYMTKDPKFLSGVVWESK